MLSFLLELFIETTANELMSDDGLEFEAEASLIWLVKLRDFAIPFCDVDPDETRA